MALSDTELILEAKEGNNSAFEQLVYRYDRHVLSLAMKYSGNNDDAMDIYQEVFIRMYKGLKKFRFQSEFSTWLFRITTNVCLTYKSKQNKRERLSLSFSDDDDENSILTNLQAEENENPDSAMMGNEINEKIELAIKALTPKQKLCFTLKHMEGYKLREIAVMMDCKEGTVKKYLFDAVRKIREQLKDYSYNGV
jgi:RNA polymerase sigma-70 factor, ECF subfamily